MSRLRWIASTLQRALVAAWWDAWDEFWATIGDAFNPDYQRDVRSQERNDSIHDIDRGGNAFAAGCGSDEG